MAKLWRPNMDVPDANNFFDMMVVFQQELYAQPKEAHEEFALNGLGLLLVHLHNLRDEQRDLTVVTDLAVIDDSPNVDDGTIVERVGLNGYLSNVHCISLSQRLPNLSYSLEIDAMSIFPPDNPTDSDMIIASAITPIVKVNFIETAA